MVHFYRGAFRSAIVTVLMVAAGAVSAQTLPGVPVHQAPAPSTTISRAHGRFSYVPLVLDQPNLALALALVAAGGGPTAFDADAVVEDLIGNGSFGTTERAALSRKFGAANIASFDKTFGYFVSDALVQTAKAGMTFPAAPLPDPHDAKALAAALYTAGMSPSHAFNVEVMLDRLISHVVHVTVMNDIDASDLGYTADANYHLILGQLIVDTAKADGIDATSAHGSDRR